MSANLRSVILLKHFGIAASLFAVSSAVAGPTGFYDPTRIWKDKKSLRVCFASNLADLKDAEYDVIVTRQSDGTYIDEDYSQVKFVEFPAEYRAQIQKAVQNSFSIAKTGIQFTGFKSCVDDPKSEVVLYYTDTPEGAFASSRANWPLVNNKIVNYTRRSIRLQSGFFVPSEIRYKKIFELERLIPGIDPIETEKQQILTHYQFYGIVHEFGHILGLHHESDRDDGDETNRKVDLSKNFDRSDFYKHVAEIDKKSADYKSTHKKVGTYSAFSVMSYLNHEIYYFARRNQLLCDYLEKMNGRKELQANESAVLGPIWYSMSQFQSTISPLPLVPGFDPGILHEWMCSDKGYLNFIPPTPEEGLSYLNPSDEETLAFIYIKLPLKKAWEPLQKEMIRYLTTWPMKMTNEDWF